MGDIEIALLRIGLDLRLAISVEAGRAQKALDRRLRRADLRALLLLADVARARGHAAEVSASRRGVQNAWQPS